jgi:hypothetical protein
MRKRKQPIYDDQTLENMKRYYKIESHDELLQYIKKHGLVVSHNEDKDILKSTTTP